MNKNIRRVINKMFRIAAQHNVTNFINDENYLKIAYYLHTGKKLDLNNVTTFNEKLHWLKLYDRNPLYTNLVDKYLVREFIKKKIGNEYLIPLIAIYDNINDIEWEKLPYEFVLKCTHSCGTNIICKDKNKLNISKTNKILKKWMNKNLYWYNREWPYKDIKPKIIFEKFLSVNGESPNDYKIFCFNGIPEFIQVDTQRFTDHKRNIYDTEWNLLDLELSYPKDDNVLEKPEQLNTMLKLAKELSKDMKHARIDFYIVNNKIYFGEITFFQSGGFANFSNEKYNIQWGEKIKI